MGATRLTNAVTKKGKQFSFISVVGKTGYVNAPEFSSSKKLVGGGLSQLATSLYLALRDAQRNGCYVSITEQNRYGSKTPYAALGEEAYIDLQKNIDLKFTNKSGKSLRIYTYVSNDSVSVVVTQF